MPVTLTDVARKVGVTPTTVSMVLSGRGNPIRVSEKTRQRVLAAARELHYQPSFAAQALVRGKTLSIGFMCGNIQNLHYAEMADLAMQEASKHGYHLLMGITDWVAWEHDLQCFDSLMSRGIDGLIFFGTALRPGTAQYERVIRERFPLVGISQRVPGLPSIRSDWQPGVHQAIAHLKALGHTRVAYCGQRHLEKEDPIREAAGRFGLAYEAIIWEDRGCYEANQQAFDMGRDFAGRRARPGAVIVGSDFLALRFICGLAEGGLRVPSDVSVIGIDGTDEGQFFNPPLTTIAQDMAGITRQAVTMIVGMIDGKPPAELDITLPTRLLIRKSTSGPKSK